MAVITIFSGSYCKGGEIAQQINEKLKLERFDEKLFSEITRKYGVSAERINNTLTGHVSLMNKITREQEKNIAYLRAVLADLILQDNLILHGAAGFLIPRNIAHVLRVCIIANFDFRLKQVMGTEGKSEKDAQKIIHKDDMEKSAWTKILFDKPSFDESLYDLLIPMQDTTTEEAADIICENALKDAIKTTPESRQAAEDFRTAAHVNLALVEEGYDEEVTSVDGSVTIIINKYVLRLEQHQNKLKEIALKVNGVKDVQTKIGPKFSSPSIISSEELTMPKKILLVDDEKEFVHTLSERLETRNFTSSIVYDGEQALESVKKDEPEVMVLDLKMPGIDGLEVLRRVKQEHPLVEVIILTGHGSEREKALAEELGAYAYLHKPVDINILTKTMKEAYQKLNAVKAASGNSDQS
jgi:CheY-like chemotaxis protein/cytidylate kinase